MESIITKTARNLKRLKRNFVGCTPDELESVKKSQKVTKLPELYHEFLATMGKGAQGLYVGTNIYFDDSLHKLKDFATELLQESKSEFELPNESLVFVMHQGYQFMYFVCDDSNDPIVYYFLENWVQPEKKYDSLTDFFRDTIYIT